MLDQAAVEIDHVQGPIGSVEKVDRAEPFIGRGEKLGMIIGVGGGQHAVVVQDPIPPDHVPGRFTEKDVAHEPRPKLIPAIHHRSAGPGIGREPAFRG